MSLLFYYSQKVRKTIQVQREGVYRIKFIRKHGQYNLVEDDRFNSTNNQQIRKEEVFDNLSIFRLYTEDCVYEYKDKDIHIIESQHYFTIIEPSNKIYTVIKDIAVEKYEFYI